MIASLTLALAVGRITCLVTEFANLAAGVVVGKVGTATVVLLMKSLICKTVGNNRALFLDRDGTFSSGCTLFKRS